MKAAKETHPIEPTFDKNSRVLILGSFPSVRSRESGYFYGHPQNRFWRVTAAVFGEKPPEGNEEKKAFLLRHGIALWDVVHSCTVAGSGDASIRDVVPNDLSVIIKEAKIERFFTNGRTAQKLYEKYLQPVTGAMAHCLPSTSPANAAWSFERLTEAWSVIGKGSEVKRNE